MIVQPTLIGPIMPPRIPQLEMTKEMALTVLSAFIFGGIALLITWLLSKVMKCQNFKTHKETNLIITGVIATALFLRFGLSVYAVQGLFLLCLLLYASWSDITHHEMPDHIWVSVLALGLTSVARFGFASMLIGAVMVFLPQMLFALIPEVKSMGGADIKLSTALAFLLGWQRGLATLLLGLLVAVIVTAIVSKIKAKDNGKPFAVIPYLSGAAMLLFLV